MKNNITLSICIASFNHGDSLAEKINYLLSYNNSELEIIVSDNASTDGTIEILRNIKDDRFKLIENSKNNGATVNYMKALSAGTGRYSMFMTDKDSINHENLNSVIKNLKEMEFAVGFFSLDFTGKEYTAELFSDLQSCFERFAYLSKHPSGYIFNTEYLNQLDLNDRFSDPEVVGCFPFEFLCAELCQHQKCFILNIPFVVTSKLIADNQSETSMSYSEEKRNLFFSPKYRFEMLEKYIRHLNGLNLRRRIRLNLTLLLIKRAHHEAVFSYRDIINSKPHRIHYGVSEKAPREYNESLIRKQFLKSLLKSNIFRLSNEKAYILSKLFLIT